MRSLAAIPIGHAASSRSAQHGWIPAVLLMMFALDLLVPASVSAQEVARPLAETASEIRSALGYDTKTLTALGVPQADQEAIDAAVIDYARTNLAQIEPQLIALKEARRARRHASTTGAGPDRIRNGAEAEVSLHAATDSSLGRTLREHLTPQQQAIHARLAENRGLDTPLNLLGDLSLKQRRLLGAAQSRRDRMLRDPRNWHRHGVRRWARFQFGVSVKHILTPQQSKDLQQLRDRIDAGPKAAGKGEPAANKPDNGQSARPAPEPAGPLLSLVEVLRSAGQIVPDLRQTLQRWSGMYKAR